MTKNSPLSTTKNKMTYNVGHPGPRLGQLQQGGRVKL
jgi:hypothetical protein